LVSDRMSRRPGVEEARRVAEKCRERGVLVLYGGAFGNVIRLLPPLTIENSELDQALDTLSEALKYVSQ